MLSKIFDCIDSCDQITDEGIAKLEENLKGVPRRVTFCPSMFDLKIY